MRATLILPAIILAPVVASAQTKTDTRSWSGSIGISTVALPTYMGSNRYRVKAFPIFALEFNERFYIGGAQGGTGAGAGGYLVRNSAFTWAAEISGAPEREESYGDGLAGMGRRGAATFLGNNISYSLGPVTAGARVALGLGDEGSTAAVNLETKHRYGRRWMAGVSTGATVANSRNMNYDFGVSTDQAIRRQALIDEGDSRLYGHDGRTYAPKGGLKHMQATGSLGFLLTHHTTLLAFASGSRLGHEAAESPLTRQRNGVVAGMGIAYGF